MSDGAPFFSCVSPKVLDKYLSGMYDAKRVDEKKKKDSAAARVRTSDKTALTLLTDDTLHSPVGKVSGQRGISA